MNSCTIVYLTFSSHLSTRNNRYVLLLCKTIGSKQNKIIKLYFYLIKPYSNNILIKKVVKTNFEITRSFKDVNNFLQTMIA